MVNLAAHVGVSGLVAAAVVIVSFPRGAISAVLSVGVSDMIALDEAILTARVSVVARLLAVTEFLYIKYTTQNVQYFKLHQPINQSRRVAFRRAQGVIWERGAGGVCGPQGF